MAKDKMTELSEQVDNLEVLLGGVDADSLKRHSALTGEAIGIIREILGDLVTAAAPGDANEYGEDLDRLDQIAEIVRY